MQHGIIAPLILAVSDTFTISNNIIQEIPHISDTRVNSATSCVLYHHVSHDTSLSIFVNEAILALSFS